jgi:hypothetical protein
VFDRLFFDLSSSRVRALIHHNLVLLFLNEDFDLYVLCNYQANSSILS